MTRGRTDKETRKARVLEAVAVFTHDFGYPPSYRDLARSVGLAHSAVYGLVEELRTDGLINDRKENSQWHARAITLTDAGRADVRAAALGRAAIRAGS